VDAILLPTVACTWNTVIAPPMALVGQKPAPSRTDGFWVKQMTAEEALKPSPSVDEPINAKDIEALAVWSRLLLKTVPSFDKQRREIQLKANEERAASYKKEQEATEALNKKLAETIEALCNDPAQKEILDYLRSRNFNPQRTSKALTDLREYLKNELSHDELIELSHMLTRYAPATTPQKQPLRPKTDPVKHSVEVIQEIK
jgi:predicted house-cleaning noncanonical NTP pyrophosphatase (MazG superfamily)